MNSYQQESFIFKRFIWFFKKSNWLEQIKAMRSKLEDPTQARRVRSSLIGCENKDLVKTGFRSRSIFERTAKYWYTVFFYCFDKLRNLFSALKWQSKISYRESVSSHLSQSESNQLKEMSKGSFLNWVSLFLNPRWPRIVPKWLVLLITFEPLRI